MTSQKKKFTFYKPKKGLVIFDVLLILFQVSTIFIFFPLTTHEPFKKYAVPLLVFLLLWVGLSYFFQRYRKLRARSFFKHVFSLFYTTLLTLILLAAFILIQPSSPYSERVLLTVLVGVFLVEYLVLFIYFAYRYATQYELPELREGERVNAVEAPSFILNPDVMDERKDRIIETAGVEVFKLYDEQVRWNETGALMMSSIKFGELVQVEDFKYHTIIQHLQLNNIRGINRMMALINDKLPDNGVFVCCYKSQCTTRKNIFLNRNKVFAYIINAFYFLVHRVAPKFFLTKRLYYDITGGKKRILSTTEVLGRLNYNGFKVEHEAKRGDLNYVFSRRVKRPIVEGNRNYGLLIKLKRYGKNKKLFSVYKFRTMHPYAEFLQEYVYEKNKLAEGGKFQNDMRVTSLGKFMRKFWLDELPMLLNLLKGDMKLVGVRPLSIQYFNLYSQELQETRVKHRPGLLPPFYVDMPKTLDEIQASEMKYLKTCDQKGVFQTDVRYFFLILNNILFKKARSK